MTQTQHPSKKSNFTPDGSYQKDIPVCNTIGELLDRAQSLPRDLPIETGFGRGVELVWYNVGQPNEHCGLVEVDDLDDDEWDDDLDDDDLDDEDDEDDLDDFDDDDEE